MKKKQIQPSYKKCLGATPIDELVLKTCDRIYKSVKASHSTPTPEDYPPVVVGCISTNDHYLYIETTYSDEPDYSLTPELHFRLSSLGDIAKKRPQCRFPIGHCAEPKAAFRTIRETKSGLRSLRFSTAYRPRTKMTVEYCSNCKETFNL